MKIERTHNATRNIVFGVALNIYKIVVPFLMRTAMIYVLGIEYLGLNGLFTSILQVLNLAELGVGVAMVYSMYKPIADDDTATICALMKLYRKYYRIIGVVIGGAGLLLLPFISQLISGDIPDEIDVHVLYLLHLSSTVLSYWLFAYKNCLFTAHQRTDVGSKVSMVASTIQYGLQFLVLFIWKNYYAYLVITLVIQIFSNVTISRLADKAYPDYQPRGELPREQVNEINCRVRDLFTARLGAVIVNSADTIVISAFLGLAVLAVYQNYYFILVSIMGFINIVYGSCTAGIGNSLIVETKEKNFKDFNKLSFIIAWISGVCACCFLNMYQPFVELWVGKELMLPYSAVICICIYFYVFEINQVLQVYKDAAGIWHKDRWRPLVTALSNLGMNLIMVQFWGLYGVLLSTVLSTLCIGMPWVCHNLFTEIFEMHQLKSYLKNLFVNTLVVLVACCATGICCNLLPLKGILALIARAAISLVLSNVIMYTAFHNSNNYEDLLKLLDAMTKQKLHLYEGFNRRKMVKM